MTAKPYTVASPLEFDGRRYEPGEPVELAADIAGPLIADGVLVDPDASQLPRRARPSPTLSGELERALDSIRRASPDQIRAFFERLSGDDGIRAKFDAADSTPPGGAGEEGPGSESGAGREARIAGVVRGLDPDDETLWTRAGPPKVEAIEAALGFDIDTAERDAAWAAVEAERKGGE